MRYIDLINLVVGIENELFVVQCLNLVEYLQQLKVNKHIENYIVLYKLPIIDSLPIICSYYGVEYKKVTYLPDNYLFVVYNKNWFYDG